MGCGQLNTDFNYLRIRSLQENAFTNCFTMTSISLADHGHLRQNCFKGTNIKELWLDNNFVFEDGVLDDLISYGITVKARRNSSALDLAYLGVQVVEY